MTSTLLQQAVEAVPVDMLLFCPFCGWQHIDAPDERTPDWKNEPHKSHLCHGCGSIWRPADVPTNGVAELKTRGKADTWQLDDGAVPAVPKREAGRDPVAWVPYCHTDCHIGIEGEYHWDELAEKPFAVSDPEHWECRALYTAPPALQQQEEPREVDGDGPIRDGWQISIGPGHDGFGVYAHMTDYPEEGAVCICTIDPAEYPAASPSPQDFTLPMVEEGKGTDGVPEAGPLNGIPATWAHDEGAYAQCGDCGRYSADPAVMRGVSPVCECGSHTGWSGSFKKRDPSAKWSGATDGVQAPEPVPQRGDWRTWDVSKATDAPGVPAVAPDLQCWCHTCRPLGPDRMEMVLCPDCGNKRCPKANDHRNACTNSNEPGQKGSAYEKAPHGVKEADRG